MFGDIPREELEQLQDGLAFLLLSESSQQLLLNYSNADLIPSRFRIPPLTRSDFNVDGHLIGDTKILMENALRSIELLAVNHHLGNTTVFSYLRVRWGLAQILEIGEGYILYVDES